ncbi:MAG: hypothetical protein JXB39_12505 [Deltaproteobacteria bacterium]|nr:hypothetical protein [Deltaproteobacteria bacterium]
MSAARPPDLPTEPRTGRHRVALALAAALALGPFVLAWPLPLAGSRSFLAFRIGEVALHTWALATALAQRMPFRVHTGAMGFPEGIDYVLVDPANLPAFAVGSLLGPAAGYNAVVWSGLVLAGLGGALLARRVGGAPWLGAIAAMACPTLLSAVSPGTTEDFAVGWVAIHLALLLGYVQAGGTLRWLGATLSLVLAVHGGPYNGVWAALADAAVGCGLVWKARRDGWRPVGRALAVGGSALALCAPFAWTLLTERTPGLPGTRALAGLQRPPLGSVLAFRTLPSPSADVLDLWLPAAFTGGKQPFASTAYLGPVALLFAVGAVVRDRRRWPWLAGALAFALVSLGAWILVGGRPLRVGQGLVPGPAAALMAALPGLLARLTRWFRAGAVATFLLAPLVSTWGRSRAGPVVALLVVLDAVVCSPVPWPLLATPAPDVAPLLALPAPGALVDLPAEIRDRPPPGCFTDHPALLQVYHRRPTAGPLVLAPDVGPRAREAGEVVEAVAREAVLAPGTRESLLEEGFRYVVLHRRAVRGDPEARRRLTACLGEPVAMTEALGIWDLQVRGTRCREHAPERGEAVGRRP